MPRYWRGTGQNVKRESTPPKPWSGWQILMLDGLALTAGAALAARNPENEEGEDIHPALSPWAADCLAGGPVIHFAHGRVGTGFISLGARTLVGPMFVLPGVAGYCAATAGVHNCSEIGAVYGLLGGLVAVDLFDALVLAHEDVEPNETASYAPYVQLGPGSVVVGGYLRRAALCACRARPRPATACCAQARGPMRFSCSTIVLTNACPERLPLDRAPSQKTDTKHASISPHSPGAKSYNTWRISPTCLPRSRRAQ